MKNIQKTTLKAGLLVALCFFITIMAYADYGGRTGRTVSGCSCHGTASTATSLSVTSSNGSYSVETGGTLTFTVRVSNSTQSVAGVDIGVKVDATGTSTNVGTLSNSNTDLKVVSGELVHNNPKTMSSGYKDFTFTWTAPSTAGTYYLRAAGIAADNDGSESGDDPNVMTVKALTVTSASPASVTLSAPTGGESWCPGSSHNITWTSSGVTNVKLELSSDGGSTYGTTISSSTTASAGTYSWSIPSGQSAGTTYKVRISDASNASTNNVGGNFTILSSAAISTQPSSQSICPTQPVTFSVTATGSGLSYQWRKNSSNISGATSSSYSISSVASGDAGSYDCVVTGTCNSVTSNAATLTVNTSAAISTQPSSQSICPSQPVTFNVVATGSGLSYQWRKSSVNISGATNSSYTIPSVASGDAGSYDCVVTGTCNSVTSNAATLTVNTSAAITTHPASQTVCPTQNATFSIVATGTGLTYQWRKSSVNIAGATNASYTITGVTSANAGSYDCVVTGTCNAVTSNAATLTVNALTAITTQPATQSICPSQPVTFSVVAAGTGLTYQWRKNTTNITGATNSSYTIASVVSGDAGNYDCVVTGTCNAVTSNAAVLTVGSTTAINTQPATQTTCVGKSVTFTVGATGSGLTYQWRKNTTNITGATNTTYTIASAVSGDAGNYDCVITSSCGSGVTSNTAGLTVNAASSITTQPAAQSVCSGSPATFSVVVSGTSPTYQWRKNSANISGATNSTYSIGATTTADAGNYDCVATTTCGNLTSNAVALTVNSVPAITTQPAAQTVNSGSNASFTVVASGSGNTYQWRFNTTNLSGQTSSTLSLTAVTSANAGNYDVVVTNSCGNVTSNSVALTVTTNSGVAKLTLSKSNIDFGNVKVNYRKDITTYNLIKNTGTSDLKIYKINFTGNNKGMFSTVAVDLPITIKPNKTKSLTIRFRPTSEGSKSAKVEFESNSSSTSTISLKGTGTENDDDEEDGEYFTTPNNGNDHKIFIHNSWDKPENVNLNIYGKDADKFTLVSPATDFSIDPEQDQQIKIINNYPDLTNLDANLIVVFKYTSEIVTIDLPCIVEPTPVKENEIDGINNLNVYPNPATDNIIIKYDIYGANVPNIEVVDMLGNQVKKFNPENNQAGIHIINWNGMDASGKLLQNGYYMIVVKSNNNTITYPLVINR
jgi:hypothetical protein